MGSGVSVHVVDEIVRDNQITVGLPVLRKEHYAIVMVRVGGIIPVANRARYASDVISSDG